MQDTAASVLPLRPGVLGRDALADSDEWEVPGQLPFLLIGWEGSLVSEPTSQVRQEQVRFRLLK